MSGDIAIHARGLTKRFGAFTAVDGVSLDVEPGEIHGFLGPHGAGKTTTLRMIAGLLKPTSGRVLVNGHDLAADDQQAVLVAGDEALDQHGSAVAGFGGDRVGGVVADVGVTGQD